MNTIAPKNVAPVVIPASVEIKQLPPAKAIQELKKREAKIEKVVAKRTGGAKVPAKVAKAAASKKPAAKAAKKSAKPQAKKPAGKRALQAGRTFNDAQKITLLRKDNPKREGSASHKRFALYRAHATVGAYLDACQKLEATEGKPRGHYLADLRWDLKHEYIKLS